MGGPAPSRRPFAVPQYFTQALAADREAQRFFTELAPSYRRNFVLWVDAAKRPETRRRRLAKAIALLRSRQKLGLK